MEESSSWRHPIDLVTILENAFKDLPGILEEGKAIKEEEKTDWIEHPNKVIGTLLGDDPQLIVNVLLRL